MACLYLAGKVEDTPKAMKDVLLACMEKRYRATPEVGGLSW